MTDIRILNDEEIRDIEDIGIPGQGAEGFMEFWMHEDTLKRVAQAQHQQDIKAFIELVEAEQRIWGEPSQSLALFALTQVWQSLKQLVKE